MIDKTELIKSPSRAMNDEARLVVLQHIGLPAVAEMVSDVLRQNDVRAVVRSGGADAFAPLFAATSRGATVLVDARDLEHAREIYDAFFGEAAARAAEELYNSSDFNESAPE